MNPVVMTATYPSGPDWLAMLVAGILLVGLPLLVYCWMKRREAHRAEPEPYVPPGPVDPFAWMRLGAAPWEAPRGVSAARTVPIRTGRAS